MDKTESCGLRRNLEDINAKSVLRLYFLSTKLFRSHIAFSFSLSSPRYEISSCFMFFLICFC